MLILPHSTALDLEGHAYTTYAIALLCIILFYFQYSNVVEVDRASWHYCESIYSDSLDENSIDIMRADPDLCTYFISSLDNQVEFIIPELLEEITGDNFTRYQAYMDEATKLIQDHYAEYQEDAPANLNAHIMYYPNVPNPFTMITSSLAHADFGHIFFNLIFFIAFAPALELLIGNTLKYLGVVVAIMFVTSISYSLVTLISFSAPIPALGLSGVVMGMIGLSAFLMPNAKIRVFIWFFTFARNLYIPAWVLAVWYIGWDTWDMFTESDYGGVNLIAHVSGGFSGYLIGRYWLKDTREQTRDDLDDEIEYQRSKRADRHTSPGLSFSGNRRYIEDKQREKQAKKDYDEYMGKMHHHVSVHNDSEAIVMMLQEYDDYRPHPEIYEEMFERVSEWGNSRMQLCLGRTCISLLLEKKLYKRIIPILERCHSVSDEFVLASPDEVLLLAHPLIDLQHYKMARKLLKNAEQRYGEYIDATLCKLLEVKLLWHHLEQEEEARQLVNALLLNTKNGYKEEILTLAKAIATG